MLRLKPLFAEVSGTVPVACLGPRTLTVPAIDILERICLHDPCELNRFTASSYSGRKPRFSIIDIYLENLTPIGLKNSGKVKSPAEADKEEVI